MDSADRLYIENLQQELLDLKFDIETYIEISNSQAEELLKCEELLRNLLTVFERNVNLPYEPIEVHLVKEYLKEIDYE